MDFTNTSDWLKIFEASYQAQISNLYSKQHYPLQDVIIPNSLTRNVLAITTSSMTAKPTWRLGVKVRPVLDVAGLFDLSARFYSTELNKTSLCLFPDIETEYKLRISIPKWFKDISIQVWVYQQELSIADLYSLLLNVRELEFQNTQGISNLRLALERIEAKLDKIQNPVNINTGFDDSSSSGFIGII